MIRGIGLRGAVAVNVITMIGIGPLVTIPLVLVQLHGSTALVAWVVGALIALCDGLAWAELGSLYPGSGGTYVFLREAFGAQRWGRLLGFLFAWQIVLSAPLVLASGYIGFAQYATYLWAPLADWRAQGAVAAAVGVLTLVLLYRPIARVGAIGVGLAGVAVATVAGVIAASLAHFSPARAASADPHAGFVATLAAGLGPALVITLYDYYGYGAACTVGDEVRVPARVLPRSVLLSILVVGLLYVALQVGVLGAIPWHELVPATPGGDLPDAAKYVASTVVERAWGSPAARIVTFAVLATAFASTFGNLLAYSRIPYAAAVDGLFFRPFAQLGERGKFPTVALLVIGLLALPACFMSLGNVIAALTTGLVIIQSVAQLGAVAALRARGVRAPYRMWLYPVPALIALAGWAYIFLSAGTQAIAFGVLSLLAGLAAFAWRAHRSAEWPFVAKATATLVLALGVATLTSARPAAAATWGHASVIEQAGNPVFEVDGKPFFVYGAAFFYERLPRDRWQNSMSALKDLGINTLDLYVPWNWHELSDGNFDFDGHTSPRRDFDEVLRLARTMDFKILLRPGPVIRNEWRNAGYPAWLLSRPEYGMPLHDLLEGRYPPAATLQNAHSDDAAAAWMANATHMSYAKRWLETVLRECEPDADRILAVALDDDQGAYIDNQTFPAPHFQAYVKWLRDVVHGVTGPGELTFINTYQMKVTASSPVWAMGNWYQSDAYAVGEHDEGQLEFSSGLLHTRPHQPMMASEFQAGWLEQPDDIRPRPADPTNTSLAMATMLGIGVRGIVNFPAQDTLYPLGWEAPFANSFYAWDAALGLQGSFAPRAGPTAAIGALVRTFGPELAVATPDVDAAIVYLGGSLTADANTNERFGEIADVTIDAQTACRTSGLSCALVDPGAVGDAALRKYPVILVPRLHDGTSAIQPSLLARLAKMKAAYGDVFWSGTRSDALLSAMKARGHRPAVEGIPGAHFLRVQGGRVDGFLTVTNYSDTDVAVPNGSILIDGTRRISLPPFSVPAHDALVTPVGIRLARFARAFRSNDVVTLAECMPISFDVDTARATTFSMRWEAWPSIDSPPFTALGDLHAPLQTDPTYCTVFGRLHGRTFAERIQGEVTSIGAGGTVITTQAVPAVLAPRTATLPIRVDADLGGPRFARPPAGAVAYSQDVFRDGQPVTTIDNGIVRTIVAPDAGARAFAFQDDATGRNCFTTVGALRDDVAIEPPPSTTDKIAKYTHDFPAGMFNRRYGVTLDAPSAQPGASAGATFAYDAPDVVPNGAHFIRHVSLARGERVFDVVETATFDGPGDTSRQRAVSVTSLSVGSATTMQSEYVLAPDGQPFAPLTTLRVTRGNALGYYDTVTHELATIAWRAADVEDVTISERRYSLVARLTARAGGTTHARYGYETADSLQQAQHLLSLADAAAQVVPSAARTP